MLPRLAESLLKKGLGFLCAGLLIFHATSHVDPVHGCPSFSGNKPILTEIEFNQTNWLWPDNSPIQMNSLWGSIDFAYPPPDKTYYFNLGLKSTPNGPVYWAVRNLPLFAAPPGDTNVRRKRIHFDLAGLGLSPGDDWSQAYYLFNLSLTVRDITPNGKHTQVSPGDIDRKSWDLIPSVRAGSPDPGAPENIEIEKPPTKIAVGTDRKEQMMPVQEDNLKCVAGRFAQSLDWLNREYSMGSEKSGQEMYADLIGKGVSDPEADKSGKGLAIPYDEWIEAKDAYARDELDTATHTVVTKVWEVDDVVDEVPGVEEKGPGDMEFLSWLEQEIAAGEDVEIGVISYDPDNPQKGAGASHMVSVVGLYYIENEEKEREYHVIWRQDETQDDDKKGDSCENDSLIWRRDKRWVSFGGKNIVVIMAVSESVVKKPDKVAMDGEPISCGFDIAAATGDSDCVGVEQAWNRYWVTGAAAAENTQQIYRLAMDGSYLGSSSQATSSPFWGGRDGAADEQNYAIYFGAENAELVEYRYDPVTEDLSFVKAHYPPLGGMTIRALCLNPDSGHFFAKDGFGPIYEFDLKGRVFNVFSNTAIAAHGFAWDSLSRKIWASDGKGRIAEIDPMTGQLSGKEFVTALGGRSTGFDLYADWRNHGRLSALVLHQGQEDRVRLYNLRDPVSSNRTPLLDIDELRPGNDSDVRLKYAEPGHQLVVGYSLNGTRSRRTPWGVSRLAPPIHTLGTMVANAQGKATLRVSVPLGSAGVRVWLQALNIDGGIFSNTVYRKVQL